MDHQDFENYFGISLEQQPQQKIIEEDPQYYTTEADENMTVIYDEDNFVVRLIFSSMPTGLTRAILKERGLTWSIDLNSWILSMATSFLQEQVTTLLNDLGAIKEEN